LNNNQPGWYVDPNNKYARRYWDGKQWVGPSISPEAARERSQMKGQETAFLDKELRKSNWNMILLSIPSAILVVVLALSVIMNVTVARNLQGNMDIRVDGQSRWEVPVPYILGGSRPAPFTPSPGIVVPEEPVFEETQEEFVEAQPLPEETSDLEETLVEEEPASEEPLIEEEMQKDPHIEETEPTLPIQEDPAENNTAEETVVEENIEETVETPGSGLDFTGPLPYYPVAETAPLPSLEEEESFEEPTSTEFDPDTLFQGPLPYFPVPSSENGS
jgi:hypothetical protein